ncbi:hypothetical protein [Serpentinimonas maccroryi]|uniref:hypothetical protein n=1 Tax=Serpentinimonas maccroryi TaxID=1458426 RepID=UPI00203403E0|nr:hypothetical protein [Serpentinimonas maccroryi]
MDKTKAKIVSLTRDLMQEIGASQVALNPEEIEVALKVSLFRGDEFDVLANDEIESLINVMGYYLDYSDEDFSEFIDYLLRIKVNRESGAA